MEAMGEARVVGDIALARGVELDGFDPAGERYGGVLRLLDWVALPLDRLEGRLDDCGVLVVRYGSAACGDCCEYCRRDEGASIA